jgi:threonine aldolase
VGSALAGPRDFVAKARRLRKLFGGGMRQAGVLAAAALYAMEHHIERMAEDHRNAQLIAQAVMETPGLRLAPPEVETNLIWIDVDPALGSAKEVSAKLREHGVMIHPLGPQRLRACTHLDVSHQQAEHTAEVIRTVVGKRVAVPAGR